MTIEDCSDAQASNACSALILICSWAIWLFLILIYTSCQSLQISEAPLETQDVNVIGISVEDGSAELLLDNDDVLTVPAELVQQAMPENTQDIEELTSDGTVTLEITRRGADVMTLIIKH